MNAADIHARISRGGWAAILRHCGVGEEFLRPKRPGPCVLCGGVDRYQYDDRAGRGDYFCRNPDCGPGDGFDMLMKLHGWNFVTTREHVLEAAGRKLSESAPPVRRGTPRPATHDTQHLELSEYGRDLWQRCSPLAGVALEYLRARHCVIPPADGDLRWHPELRHPAAGFAGPALVALVTDTLTRKPLTLHRTWITADGRKPDVTPPRLLLARHRKAGGVVRLWPDEAVQRGLAIGEGLETMLAAAHVYTPVWSAIDAGNLASFPVLAGIEALTIVADHDEPGIAAARKCAQRWATAGHSVRIARPKTPGQDAADVGVAA